MQLAAIDTGDGAATLLLHGQPGRAGDWQAVASRLVERGLRVIAPDRPGYGRTGGRAVGFAGNARAARALLDRLEVDTAVVAGHSWASGVALELALTEPDRVGALVLVAPIAPGLPLGRMDRALANPLVGPAVARTGMKLAGLALSGRPLRGVARRLVKELPPEQVAAAGTELRRNGVWRSFYVEQRALLTELQLLDGRLGSLHKPVTIVYGTRDRIAPPANAHRLGELLPAADVVSAGPTGHLLPQQRPELVADVIARAVSGR